jgi:hypothetical protein
MNHQTTLKPSGSRARLGILQNLQTSHNKNLLNNSGSINNFYLFSRWCAIHDFKHAKSPFQRLLNPNFADLSAKSHAKQAKHTPEVVRKRPPCTTIGRKRREIDHCLPARGKTRPFGSLFLAIYTRSEPITSSFRCLFQQKKNKKPPLAPNTLCPAAGDTDHAHCRPEWSPADRCWPLVISHSADHSRAWLEPQLTPINEHLLLYHFMHTAQEQRTDFTIKGIRVLLRCSQCAPLHPLADIDFMPTCTGASAEQPYCTSRCLLQAPNPVNGQKMLAWPSQLLCIRLYWILDYSPNQHPTINQNRHYLVPVQLIQQQLLQMGLYCYQMDCITEYIHYSASTEHKLLGNIKYSRQAVNIITRQHSL